MKLNKRIKILWAYQLILRIQKSKNLARYKGLERGWRINWWRSEIRPGRRSLLKSQHWMLKLIAQNNLNSGENRRNLEIESRQTSMLFRESGSTDYTSRNRRRSRWFGTSRKRVLTAKVNVALCSEAEKYQHFGLSISKGKERVETTKRPLETDSLERIKSKVFNIADNKSAEKGPRNVYVQVSWANSQPYLMWQKAQDLLMLNGGWTVLYCKARYDFLTTPGQELTFYYRKRGQITFSGEQRSGKSTLTIIKWIQKFHS